MTGKSRCSRSTFIRGPTSVRRQLLVLHDIDRCSGDDVDFAQSLHGQIRHRSTAWLQPIDVGCLRLKSQVKVWSVLGGGVRAMRLSRAAPSFMAKMCPRMPTIAFSMLSLVRLYREPPSEKLQVCIPRRFRLAGGVGPGPGRLPCTWIDHPHVIATRSASSVYLRFRRIPCPQV
jgi:hypothetical protein